MVETLLVIIVALLVIAIGMLAWIVARGAATRIARTEDALVRHIGDSKTDVVARLERVKGELQQELGDRVSEGLLKVGKGVEGQLISGRDEQSKRLGESRRELSETLAKSTKTLEEKFAALEARMGAALETIRAKVDQRLLTISEEVQKKLEQNIKEGFTQFEKVQQHLKAAEEQLKNVGALGASVTDLNNLLKLPHLRGKFGEAALERLLADFLPAHMYEFQASDVITGRPDAVVKFPDRILPIDSKFPREQIMPLFESSDPQQLAEARSQLERVIKEQARSISKYIDPEAGTTNLALMFLPSETLWFEVVQNHRLADYLAEQHVFPVSPNTLLLVLLTVQQTFKWYQIAATFDQAREELAKAQKSFGFFQKKFDTLGKSLDNAQDAFRVASGHLSRYQSRIAGVTGEALIEGDDTTDGPELDFGGAEPDG